MSPKTSGYLPTLDGWRALAILSVLLFHDGIHRFWGINTVWFQNYGMKGVDLFFAISGLLICWRLMEEEARFGFISLKRFYLRRAFRILPAAFTCLAVIGILGLTGVFDIQIREWLGAVLFFRNYTTVLGPDHPGRYFTDHFWSLSVEEHFYLLLPALLVFTKPKYRVRVLLLLAALVEIHRFLDLRTRSWGQISFHTGVRLDALLIPAAIAILVQSPQVRSRLQTWLRFWPLLLVGIIALFSVGDGTFWQTTLIVITMPLMVLGAVLNPGNFVAKFLEWAPLRFIGRISYSLYLWQQLFFIKHFYTAGYPLGILQSTALRYVAVFACAAGSYYLLERPMIRLGHKLAPPATPGRESLAV